MGPLLPSFLLIAGLAAVPAPRDERVERHVAAMGTLLALEVEAADRGTALRASEAAVRALETVEARLSTWRDDSELARLNRAPVGVSVHVSPELASDLALARAVSRRTAGAFDPGVGELVEAWGLRTGGRRPEPAEVERALACGGLASLELDVAGQTAARRHPGLRIEEGGFGKGVGLDAALAALAAGGATRARLDLGGQVAVLGPGPFAVELAHPAERGRAVLQIEIATGSLATSGNAERGIEVDGERLGHLLDPRNGRPVADFGSVTVWAASAAEADALSTGLYVLGPERALDLAAELPDVEVCVLETTADGLRARMSPGLARRARTLDPALAISTALAREPRSR